MKLHDLKILPEHFKNVVRGKKRAEIRINDRGFTEGDLMCLREYDSGEYSGHFAMCRITHVLENVAYCGLMDGYAMLSFEIIGVE